MQINLNPNHFVRTIDQGYNRDGEVYDIEVISSSIFFNLEDIAELYETDIYSPEFIQLFRDWCNRHNVYYYAKPRESFSEVEALDEAANRCSRYILMEDLS